MVMDVLMEVKIMMISLVKESGGKEATAATTIVTAMTLARQATAPTAPPVAQ
mgnify:CR=1 FL=1